MDDDTFRLFENVNIPQKKLYERIWGGKHTSPWFFIRTAVRSSLMHATQSASLWIQHYHRAKKKCKSPAELSFISGLAYADKLSGPLLSTIILSAASVEAFARHCFVSTLRTKANHTDNQEVNDKFFEFDNTSAGQRIPMIISEVKAAKLPVQIETEINNLIGFRNEIMHSDPLYLTKDSYDLIKLKSSKKEKRTVEGRPSRFKYYPDLTTASRPLTLSHSLLSTITHDKLVEHIISTSDSPNIVEFLNEIDMTNTDKGLIWGDPTFTLDYSQAKLIAKEMNLINKELNKVTNKEQLQFINDMKRRME